MVVTSTNKTVMYQLCLCDFSVSISRSPSDGFLFDCMWKSKGFNHKTSLGDKRSELKITSESKKSAYNSEVAA